MNQVLSEANGGAPSTALFLFSIDSSFDQSNTKTPQLTSGFPQWLDFGEKRVVSPALHASSPSFDNAGKIRTHFLERMSAPAVRPLLLGIRAQLSDAPPSGTISQEN